MSGIILPGDDGSLFQRDRAWHPPADTPGYKSSTFRAPRQSLLALGPTKSELTGPTFGHERFGPLDNDLIRNFGQDGAEAIGQRLVVYGQVLDENARPVPSTLVEFWQANAGGRYRHKKEGYVAALEFLDPFARDAGRGPSQGAYRSPVAAPDSQRGASVTPARDTTSRRELPPFASTSAAASSVIVRVS